MTAETLSLTYAPVDGTDLALRDALFALTQAVGRHDLPDFPPPCKRRFDLSFTMPRPGKRISWYAALAPDGTMVGSSQLVLYTLDNTETAELEISVLPEFRRRGIGRELYRRGVDASRAEGRRRLIAAAPVGLPGRPRDESGVRFAEAMGMTNALDDVRRRLDVTALDHPALDAMYERALAKAQGYSLLRWESTPEEFLDDIAYLDSRLSIDAPLGDLVWEPEKIDADRVRAVEQLLREEGRRVLSTVARDDATGRLVAWTNVHQEHSVYEHAWQGITLVLPEYRGHRLGALVKIENLRYAMAQWPRLRHIDTWNAASNSFMVSINEAMGFYRLDGWQNLQQEI